MRGSERGLPMNCVAVPQGGMRVRSIYNSMKPEPTYVGCYGSAVKGRKAG